MSLRFFREVCPFGADGFATLIPEIVIGYVERHALYASADSGKAMCGVARAVHPTLATCRPSNIPAAREGAEGSRCL
ncbi:hypothetical protein [Agrobacterium tumefaciens]|uniref:hypothetical protein n=1 Tax=Agrobacterium tumefaciens TaxID=358 RepID=UPI001F322F2D|nr:hypothetical protein [Agrobacterium tumefaciens]